MESGNPEESKNGPGESQGKKIPFNKPPKNLDKNSAIETIEEIYKRCSEKQYLVSHILLEQPMLTRQMFLHDFVKRIIMELEQYKKDVEQGKMENLEEQQEARKYVIENFFVSLYLL